jgi:hypothetical protein
MTLHPAFKGPGLFCYLPTDTMRYYQNYPHVAAAASSGRFAVLRRFLRGTASDTLAASTSALRPDGFVRAAKDIGLSHVWVRLFGLEGKMDFGPTNDLIEALRAANISVAGWGYCHGRDWRGELATALEQSRVHGLTAFVADIEPGRLLGGTKSKWRVDDFERFVDGLAGQFGRDGVGISTWPVLKIQNDPEFPSETLMRRVSNKVGMFAPQAYWMTYPTRVHYSSTGFSEIEFPKNDPESFVRLVIASWRRTGFNQSLVITGQAYWGEGGPSLAVTEQKLAQFAANFSAWDEIAGFNLWHAGGSLAMSQTMLDTLKRAQLGNKPYGVPIEAVA